MFTRRKLTPACRTVRLPRRCGALRESRRSRSPDQYYGPTRPFVSGHPSFGQQTLHLSLPSSRVRAHRSPGHRQLATDRIVSAASFGNQALHASAPTASAGRIDQVAPPNPARRRHTDSRRRPPAPTREAGARHASARPPNHPRAELARRRAPRSRERRRAARSRADRASRPPSRRSPATGSPSPIADMSRESIPRRTSSPAAARPHAHIELASTNRVDVVAPAAAARRASRSSSASIARATRDAAPAADRGERDSADSAATRSSDLRPTRRHVRARVRRDVLPRDTPMQRPTHVGRRRTVRRGRARRRRAGSRISTVSIWSSAVCAVAITAAPICAATSRRNRQRASRNSASVASGTGRALAHALDARRARTSATHELARRGRGGPVPWSNVATTIRCGASARRRRRAAPSNRGRRTRRARRARRVTRHAPPLDRLYESRVVIVA